MENTNSFKNRLSGANGFLSRHKLLSAFILCAFFFLVYFTISGFNIISGNDDYCVFRLVFINDTVITCMGWFFTSFIAWLQPFFGSLNSYMIIQELIVFLSLLAINYVFLSKLNSKTGLFLTITFDIVYFSFLIMEILFSYTAVVACTAGFLLMAYGSLYEQRKRFKITQIVLGVFLIILGSQVRFEPVLPMWCVAFAWAVSSLIVVFLKLKKNNGVKASVIKIIKKYFRTGLLFLIALIITFGVYSGSEAIKHSKDANNELYNYNNALTMVSDRNTAPYYENKEAYDKLGIKSVDDMMLLKSWFIDNEYFTTERLKAIGEYSKEVVDDGVANRGVVGYVFNSVKKAVKNSVENSSIILWLIGLVVGVLAVVFLCLALPGSKSVVLKMGAVIFLWVFFLFVTEGFSINNILVLPMFFVALVISLRYNNFQFLITVCVSLAMTALFFYLYTMRIYINSALAVIFPAAVIMIFALEKSNKTEIKTKKSKIIYIIVSLLLISASVFSGGFLFANQVKTEGKEKNAELVEYIGAHPEYVFAINQTGLYKDYYEPFIVTEEPENVYNSRLAVSKSEYFEKQYKKNNVEYLFRDSIDSNVRFVLCEKRQGTAVIIENKGVLENYCNNHYAEPGKKISLVKDGDVDGYGFYKVVSEPADEQ